MLALVARRADEKVVAGFDLFLMRLCGWWRSCARSSTEEEEEEEVKALGKQWRNAGEEGGGVGVGGLS